MFEYVFSFWNDMFNVSVKIKDFIDQNSQVTHFIEPIDLLTKGKKHAKLSEKEFRK